jgi:glycosyltransferase involved in cell wall biosynthesis
MAKRTATVAVITRTKDRGILLERAILSVHNQTFKDFIHVIINDAGDPKIVDDLVEKHKKLINGRVSVIHNNVSRGMEAASNKAIMSVESTYVSIHDDDDSWDKSFVEKTVTYMKKNGSDGLVVVTDKIDEEVVGDKVNILSQSRWQPWVRSVTLYEQCLDNLATPISFIFLRNMYDKLGGYNNELPVAGDWDFALRFLLNSDIDFLRTEKPLAFYHHRQSTSGINQNSVFKDNGLLHEEKLTMLANRYLRQEIEGGKMGLGYLISSQRAQARHGSELAKYLRESLEASTVRIEGHVNSRIKILEDIQRQSFTMRMYRFARRVVKKS